MTLRYAIDIPNSLDPEDCWTNYGYYETHEEALKLAQHMFGADEEGRIQIVNELPPDEDEDECESDS